MFHANDNGLAYSNIHILMGCCKYDASGSTKLLRAMVQVPRSLL
jgi:hypothetical protein